MVLGGLPKRVENPAELTDTVVVVKQVDRLKRTLSGIGQAWLGIYI
jgi:hypothetical protein